MSFFPRLIVALRKPVVMAVKKPTPLTYIGAGRLRQAAELLRQTGSHRVLVMTTPGMMRRGQLDQTLSELKENGMEAVVFDRVSPDPTFGVVEEAVSCAVGCDAILAVGGGSVLDAAKTAAAAIANHKPAEKLVGTLKVKKQPMPLIAVPTTAGTGSETTIAAVISGTATHRKRQILDPKLVPFAAILDPELTVGLPQGNTIHTAMDALTHAMEAYVSTYATPETDRYAEMALNYARLNSTSNDLVFAKVEVEPVIKRVVRQYAGQFVRKHIALKCDIAPVQVLTDEKWLAFILGQLLANAVKYTESGTVTVTVTKNKVLKVSDTGIGIAHEHLDRIFERFYRVDKSHSRETGGTGLGLSIVKHGALLHGASIRLESEPGQGTRVTLVFPCAEAE